MCVSSCYEINVIDVFLNIIFNAYLAFKQYISYHLNLNRNHVVFLFNVSCQVINCVFSQQNSQKIVKSNAIIIWLQLSYVFMRSLSRLRKKTIPNNINTIRSHFLSNQKYWLYWWHSYFCNNNVCNSFKKYN